MADGSSVLHSISGSSIPIVTSAPSVVISLKVSALWITSTSTSSSTTASTWTIVVVGVDVVALAAPSSRRSEGVWLRSNVELPGEDVSDGLVAPRETVVQRTAGQDWYDLTLGHDGSGPLLQHCERDGSGSRRFVLLPAPLLGLAVTSTAGAATLKCSLDSPVRLRVVCVPVCLK